MSSRHVFRHMPFAADDLHNLAWEVLDYPKFINFITSVRILSSTQTTMRAEVRVRYKVLRESFITDVTRDLQTGEIFVKLARGPLRKLENNWRFHILSDGSTLLEFWVDYAFAVPWLGKIFKNKQARAEDTILNAFEARAKQRFNRVDDSNPISSTLAEEIKTLQRVTQ
ncbi:hypothetical protein MNBD_ALPHA06-1631 [hydrothermal vent metagenome]|uniref:Coenzyme Q-binding protein COQ10 START domain-containing protein n=1 Tax=hydrothermal vent metagenome TaxID=652676 RepID=A0A3B0T6H0_9ZZZZ